MPVLALSTLACASARAAPPAGEGAMGPAAEGVELRVGGGMQTGWIPAFRASTRDRLAGWAQVGWTPDPLLTAWVHGGVAHDRAPAGMDWTGPTALTLGSRLRPLVAVGAGAGAGGPAPVDLALSWWAGVPLAGDRGAVDSDEADLSFALEAGRALGAMRLDGSLGLAILGNPLRLANQDDQPLAGLLWTWASDPTGRHPLEVHARAGGSLRTPRNPARTEAAVGLELRCPLRVGVEAGAGLSPAAPDLLVDAWLGWGTACRHGARD